MSLELLLDQFDNVIQTPADVKKLNQSILQWAVMGSLVPQDPNDEPAKVLLERIAAKKAELVKGSKIKKRKPLPPIEDEDTPYKLPNGWIWVRLPEIGVINPRNDVEEDLDVSFIPMKLVPTKYGDRVSSDSRRWGEIKRGYTHFQENDVTFAKITPCFQNRKSTVMEGLVNGLGAGTTELVVFRGDVKYIMPEYVLLFFKSPGFINGGVSRMKGTAGQQRVPKEYYVNVPFPLPPFTEQQRILTKVEELFEKTRELADRLNSADSQRKKFHTSAIHRLTEAKTPQETGAAWHLIRDNFDRTYTDPQTIDELKQAILQLAIMGRLVPQNPNDEPADVLLERITAEKARLVESGSIRKDKGLESIPEGEKLFDLPSGWAWARLGHLITFLNGFAFKSDSYVKRSSNQLIRLGNVKNDLIKLDAKPVFIPDKIAQSSEKYLLHPGDLLITMTGTKGKRDYGFTAVLDSKHFDRRLYLNQRVGRLKVIGSVMPKLLSIFMKSSFILNQLLLTETGTANQGNIGSNSLKSIAIPVPPKEEQARIVAKVEQLAIQAKELVDQIESIKNKREQLLDAILTESF